MYQTSAPFDPVGFIIDGLEDELAEDFAKGRLIIQALSCKGLPIYEAFTAKIRSSWAYQNLVKADVDGAVLSDVCILIRAMVLATPAINAHLSKPPRGRRQTLRPLFKYVCYKMLDGRTDGRRFYDEFATLHDMVFQDQPASIRPSGKAVKEYRRGVIAARDLFDHLVGTKTQSQSGAETDPICIVSRQQISLPPARWDHPGDHAAVMQKFEETLPVRVRVALAEARSYFARPSQPSEFVWLYR